MVSRFQAKWPTMGMTWMSLCRRGQPRISASMTFTSERWLSEKRLSTLHVVKVLALASVWLWTITHKGLRSFLLLADSAGLACLIDVLIKFLLCWQICWLSFQGGRRWEISSLMPISMHSWRHGFTILDKSRISDDFGSIFYDNLHSS